MLNHLQDEKKRDFHFAFIYLFFHSLVALMCAYAMEFCWNKS
jgi:hypothetical protein